MSILLPENSISITLGTSKTLCLSVKDKNGDPVNLVGVTVYFTVKKSEKDVHPIVQKISSNIDQIEIANPTDGKAKIFILPTDTKSLCPGRYKFDVWVVLGSGEHFSVVGPSIFEITSGITVIP